MSDIVYKLKNRRGVAADWLLADPVLSDGEFGIESDTGKIKVGDGVTVWSVLPYLTDHDHDEAYSGITHDHVGIGDALSIQGVAVNDADLADGRILIYDAAGDGSLKYADPPEGGGAVAPAKAWYPLGAPRVLDLTVTDPDLKGFNGGFTDGRYGYFVPNYNGSTFGKVARVDLSDFSSVTVLDLTVTDVDLKGFWGGFTDGRYGYFVPYNNGTNFGKIARVDLSDFSSVTVLDLTVTDPDLKGFRGGFTDGRYGYFVPYYNGTVSIGKVARVDLSDFSSVDVLDMSLTDADLKGFLGGFTDGRYGYFVPNYNGSTFGKVARIQMFNGGLL